MNQLYVVHTYEYINDIETYSSGWCRLKWHYGELPKNETYTINDFNIVYNENTFKLNYWTDVTLFKKKPVLRFDDGKGYRKIKEDEFVSYRISYEYVSIDIGYYTLEDLMQRLSADDFISYCKDRGLNTCPLKV